MMIPYLEYDDDDSTREHGSIEFSGQGHVAVTTGLPVLVVGKVRLHHCLEIDLTHPEAVVIFTKPFETPEIHINGDSFTVHTYQDFDPDTQFSINGYEMTVEQFLAYPLA